MKRLLSIALVAALALSAGAEEEEADFPRWSVSASGTLLLPQGGARLRRVGGASVRVGYYLTEDWAMEGEAAALENVTALSVGVLGHFQGWRFYGDLFGYSRFDPFLTLGAKGWIASDGGQVGPKAGLGAFYHVTDSWAVRVDADATLGLESRCEILYSLSVGVQYSF